MPSNVAVADLASQINQAHALAMRSVDEALTQARICGDLLVVAKSKVPHGQWLPWLRDNCAVDVRQAQRYMRLSQHWTELTANTSSKTHLVDGGLAGALERLSGPPESLIAKIIELLEHTAHIAALWRAATPEQLDVVQRTMPAALLDSTCKMLGEILEPKRPQNVDADDFVSDSLASRGLIDAADVGVLVQMHSTLRALQASRA
jgi:hypothetical protein